MLALRADDVDNKLWHPQHLQQQHQQHLLQQQQQLRRSQGGVDKVENDALGGGGVGHNFSLYNQNNRDLIECKRSMSPEPVMPTAAAATNERKFRTEDLSTSLPTDYHRSVIVKHNSLTDSVEKEEDDDGVAATTSRGSGEFAASGGRPRFNNQELHHLLKLQAVFNAKNGPMQAGSFLNNLSHINPYLLDKAAASSSAAAATMGVAGGSAFPRLPFPQPPRSGLTGDGYPFGRADFERRRYSSGGGGGSGMHLSGSIGGMGKQTSPSHSYSGHNISKFLIIF